MFAGLLFFAFLAVSLGAVVLWTRPRRNEEILAGRLRDLYRTDSKQTGSLENHRAGAEPAQLLSTTLQHAIFDGLRTLLVQSRSHLSLPAFLLRSLVPGAVLAAAALVLAPFALPVTAVAFFAGSLLPWFWLRMRRNRRLRRFEGDLPAAADLMGRALRAGHSVQQALELVGTESTGPLAEEFLQLHQEQKFGVPLRDAMRALAARVPSRDLHFLVTAIVVQKDTGGDLIGILDRTSQVIRDRQRVQREVKTYTAQGRLTGWILSALPVVLLALTAIITPSYSAVMFHDLIGQLLLGAAAALILSGSLLIRRIVRVEV